MGAAVLSAALSWTVDCTPKVGCEPGDGVCNPAMLFLYTNVCDIPYSQVTQPSNVYDILTEYRIQALRGSGVLTITSFTGPNTGTNDFWGSGGVLAPNGKIYAPPNDQAVVNNQVLVIDPETNSAKIFAGPLGAGRSWSAGALAPDGKIYAFPLIGTTGILVIDPNTDSATIVGNVVAGYGGAMLAPNGKIYGIPILAGRQVVAFDPVTQTTSLFGPSTGGWAGATLAPNGKIYSPPNGSITVAFLEIDPTNDSANAFGPSLAGNGWFSGALAPNGKIYGAPVGNHGPYMLDPNTKDVTIFGTALGTNAWEGNVAAANGKIYGTPRTQPNLMEIDPAGPTPKLVGTSPGFAYTGGILVPDGRIF